MIVEVYANGAMVRIFRRDYVATRLYWRRDVWTEHRESYELRAKEVRARERVSGRK
jgi:hypothetical protein